MAIAILDTARADLAENGWVQGRYDVMNYEMEAYSRNVHSAIDAAYDVVNDEEKTKADVDWRDKPTSDKMVAGLTLARKALYDQVPDGLLFIWNETPGRTAEEVQALLGKAIENIQAEGHS